MTGTHHIFKCRPPWMYPTSFELHTELLKCKRSICKGKKTLSSKTKRKIKNQSKRKVICSLLCPINYSENIDWHLAKKTWMFLYHKHASEGRQLAPLAGKTAIELRAPSFEVQGKHTLNNDLLVLDWPVHLCPCKFGLHQSILQCQLSLWRKIKLFYSILSNLSCCHVFRSRSCGRLSGTFNQIRSKVNESGMTIFLPFSLRSLLYM